MYIGYVNYFIEIFRGGIQTINKGQFEVILSPGNRSKLKLGLENNLELDFSFYTRGKTINIRSEIKKQESPNLRLNGILDINYSGDYRDPRVYFSLSSDYDSTDKATQIFFAETQNKILYAITKKTAAEIIVNRADKNKSLNSGLYSHSRQAFSSKHIHFTKCFNRISNWVIHDMNTCR